MPAPRPRRPPCPAWLAGLALLGVLGLCPTHTRAQVHDGFGLGLVIGDPTGLSGKAFVSQTNAIDFAAGLGFIDGKHLQLHADYLWHFDIKAWPEGQLDLYLGVGPKLGLRNGKRDDDVLLGARGPVGLAMRFSEAPFDVFVELAAGLWIVEKLGFDLDAAIGGRFWF